MTRDFESETDALVYTAKVGAGSVRLISRCRIAGCDEICAVSVRALWVINGDLFGKWHVVKEPTERPMVDPCGHGARVWTIVETVPNASEPCGEGCRNASSAFCRCSCEGAMHGMRHRPRTSGP